jgi:hypothetical protein
MNAYAAESWGNFAMAVAAAGAALAGLLFVALSINLEAILRDSRLPARAGQTLILLAAPVVIALLLLIPGQPPTALGIELIVTGFVTGVSLGFLDRPSHRSSQQSLIAWVIGTAIPALLLSVGAILGGIGQITESLGGLYWLPAGVIAAFLGALLNAWVLLVEILR